MKWSQLYLHPHTHTLHLIPGLNTFSNGLSIVCVSARCPIELLFKEHGQPSVGSRNTVYFLTKCTPVSVFAVRHMADWILALLQNLLVCFTVYFVV